VADHAAHGAPPSRIIELVEESVVTTAPPADAAVATARGSLRSQRRIPR